jgi:hypothetical protein
MAWQGFSGKSVVARIAANAITDPQESALAARVVLRGDFSRDGLLDSMWPRTFSTLGRRLIVYVSTRQRWQSGDCRT